MEAFAIGEDVAEWLMEGDPVIRWQTMRDLLGCPESEWTSERAWTTQSGWGARFAECLRPNGTWPEGRWIVEKRIPGDTLFDMEKMGGDSRWNTLRALRVLKCRHEAS